MLLKILQSCTLVDMHSIANANYFVNIAHVEYEAEYDDSDVIPATPEHSASKYIQSTVCLMFSFACDNYMYIGIILFSVRGMYL